MLSFLQLLSADLEHVVLRNNFIAPILQIPATLHIYATEHFQIIDANLFGFTQPLVCCIIKRVFQAIPVKNTYITFPCVIKFHRRISWGD